MISINSTADFNRFKLQQQPVDEVITSQLKQSSSSESEYINRSLPIWIILLMIAVCAIGLIAIIYVGRLLFMNKQTTSQQNKRKRSKSLIVNGVSTSWMNRRKQQQSWSQQQQQQSSSLRAL